MNTPNLLQTVYKNGTELYDEVRQMIAQGADIDHITEYGESALRVASNNGRFDIVKLLLDAGAAEYQLEWTDVMHEVVFGTNASIRQKISETGNLETVDFWSRTPFLMAVQLGDDQKVLLLLELGANKNAVGRCSASAMQYAIKNNHVAMLQFLLNTGFDIEARDEFLNTPLISAASLGQLDCVRFLIEHGADIYTENHIPERAIEVASNMDVIKLLVNMGEDINDISAEMHAQLLGIAYKENPQVSKTDYLAARYREFGTGNAVKTNKPFWLAMIRSGASAWRASETFHDDGSHDDNIIWCYERYGRTTSILPDGRIIEIGGEHEDFYDPDFCIYNDVTVFEKSGDINIYSYAREIFPPTDFHTATLVDDAIFIIGRLGYQDARIAGHTAVYKLDTKSLKISPFDTQGDDPGFISRHKARLKNDKIFVSGGKQIVIIDGKEDYIANTKNYQLCLKTAVWSVI
ncbi:ankyrin repeat domain-containing protein [Undibacterium sp. TC4M20W]|uniref:ankyrin repeat domain-containing protein n=1 Tax=unclassified Undibacterium TaxID=2630295 RepID=UPI003BF1A4D2